MPAGTARYSVEELLHVAVDRAMRELVTGNGADADIREQLSRVSRLALRMSMTGRADALEAAAPRSEQATIPVHYFDALRNAVLVEVSRGTMPVDARDLATLVSAIERANAEHSSNGHYDFTRHLASPDAVNAVVEIAHDMRSPLTSILFLVDTLRRGQSGPVTPVQERQLGLIYGAALGLNTLSCDVIDALRGGQRLVDGHPIPFSISQMIVGVCDTVRPISEEKGVPIRHVLATVDGRIGYPGILARVLLNLVTNALKFTQDGTVEVGASDLTETSVRFWVADTGEGIPPHVMAMLFDGFRPSASGVRFSNAGLGLAICQNFLGAMGATLQVESAAHRGTRFSFEINLPRA
ncbi:MAG: HAMP domain-containing histidine kinase [Gemmatimonadota bacterium]|nr:HAMP domain-containing histidine kinase [Gemmatimonadota bacterium]